MKIFVTGDNHIGKRFDRYPDVRNELISSRFECMRNMVRQAEKEGCGLFVVAGDLFDNINNIKVGDVRQAVDILAQFSGTVLVLPGNHDYYTGEEKVWKDFEKALQEQTHNIILLTEWKEYPLEIGDEKAVIYPAFCQSKHSRENNLAWIKEKTSEIENMCQPDTYCIGIAHGALQGVTPDMKEEYFLMTEAELLGIPMDVWLIGHTHLPYPALDGAEDVTGYKIFNAGTHEQLDLHNNTEGCCFVITLNQSGGQTVALAHKVLSGRIRYYDFEVTVETERGDSLREKVEQAVVSVANPKDSIVRMKISGVVQAEEYEERKKIYRDVFEKFLSYECVDTELSGEITIQKIRDEYSELSFAAQFMEQLMGNPKELQMAYQMLKELKSEENAKRG